MPRGVALAVVLVATVGLGACGSRGPSADAGASPGTTTEVTPPATARTPAETTLLRALTRMGNGSFRSRFRTVERFTVTDPTGAEQGARSSQVLAGISAQESRRRLSVHYDGGGSLTLYDGASYATDAAGTTTKRLDSTLGRIVDSVGSIDASAVLDTFTDTRMTSLGNGTIRFDSRISGAAFQPLMNRMLSRLGLPATATTGGSGRAYFIVDARTGRPLSTASSETVTARLILKGRGSLDLTMTTTDARTFTDHGTRITVARPVPTGTLRNGREFQSLVGLPTPERTPVP